MVSLCVNPIQKPHNTLKKKKVYCKMCPMFHPVQGANNVFLTHLISLHYISHLANSKWVRRGELGPYGRLKCSKSHRINLESLRWATQRPLQKSLKNLGQYGVKVFFSNPPFNLLHSHFRLVLLKRDCKKYYRKPRTIQALTMIQHHPKMAQYIPPE